MKGITVLSELLLISSIAFSSNLDMRTYELAYNYTGSIGGKAVSAIITCRPIKDTIINGIGVIKYRFVKTETDSSDTSFDYLNITDTSVINYAWRGNTPFILLKRASTDDSLFLEDSPYTTFGFPFKLNAKWLTRPDSTGLQSQKEYIGQESLTTPAGTFYCNKVHTDILVTFHLTNVYSDQWSIGNTVVKSYINEGVTYVTDDLGNPIDSSNSWELFELKTASLIEPAQVHQSDNSHKVILDLRNVKSNYGFVALNGKCINSKGHIGKGIYVNRSYRQTKAILNSK
jgi:hypothetical protein